MSFDGFTSTPEYQTLTFAVRDALGVGPSVSVGLYLAGFALFCVSFAGTVAIANLGSGASGLLTGVREFAPTVLPIAVAYEIAHNYPYVENLGSVLTVIGGYATASPPEFAPLAWLSLSAF